MVQDIVPGKLLFKSLERLAREDVTSENALLVFRTPSRAVFQLPEVWEPERKLEYSRMEVHWFRKKALPVDDQPGETAAQAASLDEKEEVTGDTTLVSDGDPGESGLTPETSE